ATVPTSAEGAAQHGAATDVDAPVVAPVSTTAILEATNLVGRMVRGVSFALHDGEGLGVTGRVGSGLEELALLVSGRADATAGSVSVDGRPSPSRRGLERRVGYLPPNRLTEGILPRLSVGENASILTLQEDLRLGALSARRERDR